MYGDKSIGSVNLITNQQDTFSSVNCSQACLIKYFCHTIEDKNKKIMRCYYVCYCIYLTI